MGNILSIDSLVAKSNEIEEHSVPELDGRVRLRPLTRAAQSRLRREVTGKDGKTDNEAFLDRMLVECVVDPKLTLAQVQSLDLRIYRALVSVVVEAMGMEEGAVDKSRRSFSPGDEASGDVP